MQNYVQKGIELANQAISADENGRLNLAFSLYLKSLDYFELELKHGKNPHLKNKIRTQMLQYVKRAEQIRERSPASTSISRQEKQKINNNGNGNGDEDERLRNAISSTITKSTQPIHWSDVAGLEEAKKSLKEAAIIPIKAPHLLEGVSGSWKGILLYGPPGTGKSHLARAVATEAGATFFSISASNMISKWVGESERLVRALFDLAREQKPAIIFVDEIDALLPIRSDGGGGGGSSGSGNRVVGEFLTQLDGVGRDQKNVLFLGATNRPWALDPAVLRTGRFEKKIYIPLPDVNARIQLFKIHSKGALSKEQCIMLSECTEGFSGSDVAGVVKAAELRPLRKVQEATHFKLSDGRAFPCDENDPMGEKMSWEDFDDLAILDKPDLCFDDFMVALKQSKASVDPDSLPKYEEWTQKFGIK